MAPEVRTQDMRASGLSTDRLLTVVPVSLVTTIFNERLSLEGFLRSIFDMKVLPAEVIIVDGGSTDGSVEFILESVKTHSSSIDVRVIVDDMANRQHTVSPIARGRNTAITEARHHIIAVTDAGTVLEEDWLEKITAPLLNDASTSVVGGWYRGDESSFMERCIGTVFIKPVEIVNPKTFIPSSRSIAFRKEAWEAVGGYPEISCTAEDTAFVLRLRDVGCGIAFAPDALVRWRVGSSLIGFSRMIFRYGVGDGASRLFRQSFSLKLIRVLLHLIIVVLSLSLGRWYLLFLALYLWWIPFLGRWRDAFRPLVLLSFPLLGIIKIGAEVSYLWGYVNGFTGGGKRNSSQSDMNTA